MHRKILIVTLVVVVGSLLMFGIINKPLAVSANSDMVSIYGRGGNGTGTGGGWGTGTGILPGTSELNAEESASLVYMVEEEKLAHDVYIALYSEWSLPVFQTISQSEQVHMNAVNTLIERYGLTNPTSSQAGVFTNADLQKLYNDLTVRGSQSLSEALKVGAAIEEIDIRDLQTRIASIDNADILQVFNNLLNGSNNHLRAFVSTLKIQTGEIYQSQYLSSDVYQAILSTSSGYGNGFKGKGTSGH